MPGFRNARTGRLSTLPAMSSPKRGLYEALATEALEVSLRDLDEHHEPSRSPLRPAEAADRVALHLGAAVRLPGPETGLRPHTGERSRAGTVVALLFEACCRLGAVNAKCDQVLSVENGFQDGKVIVETIAFV